MSRFATCSRRSSYSLPASLPESRDSSLYLRFGEQLLFRLGDQLRARIGTVSRDLDLDLDVELDPEEDLSPLGGGDGE